MIDFNKPVMLDGGMGSMLIKTAGMPAGFPTEKLNLTDPRAVAEVHGAYIAAGSDVIFANTFGANPFKYGDRELGKIISAGIDIARKAAEGKAVALDIGSLGKLIGEGGISFEEAYLAFKKIVDIAADRQDVTVIETVSDMAEMRAALLAVKENSKKQVMVSMTFEKNGRTVFGTDLHSFALTAQGLGADAIGINCTLGPVEMLPLATELTAYTSLPVFMKPNAGMPKLVNGRTEYDVTPETFAEQLVKARERGVLIVGGCCGTTPEHISIATRLCAGVKSARVKAVSGSAVCSARKTVRIDGMKVIGERINPTGKKRFREALLAGDIDYVLARGAEQAEQGADLMDVNVGVNGIDEPAVLEEVVRQLQKFTDAPLVPDSSNAEALERALRIYNGKALVNSVNGKDEVLDALLPVVKKYGAAVIGLTIDENGIPESVEGRLAIARKIVDRCLAAGISEDDIYIDTLTMAEAAGKGNALCTLNTLEKVRELGVKTVLGISNISFGMPNRPDINAKFLEMAREAGLDLAIINPSLLEIKGSKEAEDFLLAKEGAADRYIEFAAKLQAPAPDSGEAPHGRIDLKTAIIKGLAGEALKTAEQEEKVLSPLEIVSKHVIPALDVVGELYEKGRYFLPQLIASAEAAGKVFEHISLKLPPKTGNDDRRFVVCTVKGDIHDIGKNIVKAVVGNYGYSVIDLGKDVDYDRVTAAVRANYPCVLGLSALMTTTVENMRITIEKVKAEYPDLRILTGGAVLTPEYARSIGGIYCSDANDTVKKLNEIFKNNI